eukprot:341411-Chlamydomonas_euryale.AAC.5
MFNVIIAVVAPNSASQLLSCTTKLVVTVSGNTQPGFRTAVAARLLQRCGSQAFALPWQDGRPRLQPDTPNETSATGHAGDWSAPGGAEWGAPGKAGQKSSVWSEVEQRGASQCWPPRLSQRAAAWPAAGLAHTPACFNICLGSRPVGPPLARARFGTPARRRVTVQLML